MSLSVLTITGPDGNLLSVEVGDTTHLHDLRDAHLKTAPAGTRSSIHHLDDVTGCQHHWKVRLAGAEPRLWQCAGNHTTRDGGCHVLFVEGRTWAEYDEPAWIPTGRTALAGFACGWCLDGFCTSVDQTPCSRCGAATARLVGGAR